jgi:hypothetical protein
MSIKMSHCQLAWLLDVARAGDAGLAITPSSEGIVELPAGVVDLSYANGWRATVTTLGKRLVEAIRKKDAA